MGMTHKQLSIELLKFSALILIVTLLNRGEHTSAQAWSGQESPVRQAPVPAPTPESPTAMLIGPDYRIGLGDVIEIRVDKAQELSGIYRVSSNGTFQMYYLGEIVAQHKSPEQLSALIADGLRGRYLKSPRVTVEVKQYNSRAIFVQGAVRTPGVYQLGGKVSLLKLISLCGGLADNHGASAFIFREVPTDASVTDAATNESAAHNEQSSAGGDTATPDYVFKPVSIAGLLRGNLSENVMIEPHDIVNIPAADLFFVAGEVRAPGSFQLKPGTTLRQAISLAQGTTIQAATSRAMIFREDASGKRVDVKVNVGAVMAGKEEDLAIRANDIIVVPNSKLKSVGAALLRSVGGWVTQAPFRY